MEDRRPNAKEGASVKTGRNPTRRNRNIGTAKQGRGRDNTLVVPRAWPDDRVFWEVLANPVGVPRSIGDLTLTFLVEPVRRGCFHPCTVDDICRVLSFVRPNHLDGIDLIILRQPTRKQALLERVWGRLLYYATTGHFRGTAICLEAQDLSKPLKRPLSLSPELLRELERLRDDGHTITRGRRCYRIERTEESVRNTMLFRTLVHEVGHYLDWLQSVILPSLDIDDPNEDERIDREFETKPASAREDFAHRYATEQGSRLRSLGQIPFPRLFDSRCLESEGLDPSWFRAPGAACDDQVFMQTRE